MLGAHFETQMEHLFKAFLNAFNGEDYSTFSKPEVFKTLMALIGTNSQGIATSPFAEWVKKSNRIKIITRCRNRTEQFY